jgi:hypothetical protein
MLGRLEMDVDECIDEYKKIFQVIFEDGSNSSSWFWKGSRNTSTRNSQRLKHAIEDLISRRNISTEELFNDGNPRKCKV